MALDSSRWKHQLGEATITLQGKCFLVVLTIVSFLALTAGKSVARTDFRAHPGDSSLVTALVPYESPFHGERVIVSPLPPPYQSADAAPIGLRNMGVHLHIPNQPAIERYVRYFKGRGRRMFVTALDRSWPHVQVMSDILRTYGVPPGLVYVVLVESCFDGRACSPMGAGGYWQLLPSTARWLGLRVDRWVDERWDPIKSTEAAAKYLRILDDKYHSWAMALAAYNAGEVAVQAAIRKCHSENFWEIAKRGYLPAVTRAYVPKVMAAIRIARHLEKNDFKTPRYLPIVDFESIWVNKPLPLRKVARWIGVSVSNLRSLNPALRWDRLPPGRGYALRLPAGSKEKFSLAFEEYLRKRSRRVGG